MGREGSGSAHAKPQAGRATIEIPDPAAAGDDAAVELEFDEILGGEEDEEPVVPAATVVRRAGRSRRKTRGNPVLAGLLLLAVLGGIAAAGWLTYARLAGPPPVVLAATALPADAAEPAEFVPPSDADPRAVAVVAAGVPMRSPLLSVTLSAAPGPDGAPADPPRVRVSIEPGEAGRLVRADLAGRPEVAAWLETRRDLIGAKRLAFVKARDAFYAAVAAGGDVGDLPRNGRAERRDGRARLERRGRRRRPPRPLLPRTRRTVRSCSPCRADADDLHDPRPRRAGEGDGVPVHVRGDGAVSGSGFDP